MAKAKPGDLTYGSAGNGSSGHLAGELLKSSAGIDVLHVPYKGGAPAVTDLLGERLSFMPINPLEVDRHVQAGRLRVLAVGSDKRVLLLPTPQRWARQAFPASSRSVVGVGRTREDAGDIVAKLNAETNRRFLIRRLPEAFRSGRRDNAGQPRRLRPIHIETDRALVCPHQQIRHSSGLIVI